MKDLEVRQVSKSILSQVKSDRAAVMIEDFEFSNVLKETEYGKTYLAKLPTSGTYFDVLVMRKDKLIKNNLLDSLK